MLLLSCFIIYFLNENEDENEDYFVPVLLLSCFIIYLLNENEDENEDYFCSRVRFRSYHYCLTFLINPLN